RDAFDRYLSGPTGSDSGPSSPDDPENESAIDPDTLESVLYTPEGVNTPFQSVQPLRTLEPQGSRANLKVLQEHFGSTLEIAGEPRGYAVCSGVALQKGGMDGKGGIPEGSKPVGSRISPLPGDSSITALPGDADGGVGRRRTGEPCCVCGSPA